MAWVSVVLSHTLLHLSPALSRSVLAFNCQCQKIASCQKRPGIALLLEHSLYKIDPERTRSAEEAMAERHNVFKVFNSVGSYFFGCRTVWIPRGNGTEPVLWWNKISEDNTASLHCHTRQNWSQKKQKWSSSPGMATSWGIDHQIPILWV